MKIFIITILLLSATIVVNAQEIAAVKRNNTSTFSPSFTNKTKIISFGLGFPNLYRIKYDEPAGYTHLKTSGFGPFCAKLEFGAFDNLGLVTSFGYSTFHYSYYDFAYYPAPTPPQEVIYYDDVNILNLSFSANYHFNKWIKVNRLDTYAGAGLGVDYFQYRYGNIPPYRERESKAAIFPVGRVGARYYFDKTLSLYGETGYDGISIIQLGFSVKF